MTYGKEQAKILAQQVRVVVPTDLDKAAKVKRALPTAEKALTLSERISGNICRYREKMGVPQYVASARAGLSYGAWQKYENGTVPKLDTLEKICKCLNVSASDILGF